MFRAPCSSGGWGVGGWDGWWLGGTPHTCAHPHTCMHTQVRTCMRGKHDNFMQMAAPIGGIHGNSLWCHMCVHVHACTCVCTCVGTPSHHPHPHPPTLYPWGTPRISQNSIALKLIEILQFCLKIWNLWRLPHPREGVKFGGWVGGWVDGWHQVKSLKI